MSLKLLSETRRACFRVILSGALVVVLLVFLQTIGGKFEEATAAAWLWVFAVALLPALALWVSVLLNRYPSKLFQPGAFWALVLFSLAFEMLIVLTLLAEPFATREARSTLEYLQQSYWWLLPVELLLFCGYYLAFYRKEALFMPNGQMILDFAAQKAADWHQKGNPLRQQCFESVASNDLPGAFNVLKTQFEKNGTDDIKSVVILENQYRDLQRQRELNMVEAAPAQVALNRITMGVLNLVDKL